jgi:hypothetical protein
MRAEMGRTTVRDRLIEIEMAEFRKGPVENPPGSNNIKYNTAYYGHPVSNPPGARTYAWCVVFQWWCFRKAGIPSSIFPSYANVFAVRDWFKARDRYFRTPMKGDLVIFSRSHIGFVARVTGTNEFETIEGNVRSTVVQKRHNRNEGGIDGFCRPEYHYVGEGLAMADANQIMNFLQEMKEDMVVFGSTGLEKTVEDFAARQREALAKLERVDQRLKAIERHLNIPPS